MTTYYIAPTTHATTPGNDTTGNGSSATPWATISKAHTSAASGDTIICKTGTYTWSSQTFTKDLTIQGESKPVYNPATKAWTGAIFTGTGAWINTSPLTLSRLIFSSITATSNDGLIRFSENLTIQQCIFTSISLAGGAGVNVQNGGMFNEGITNKTLSVSNCIFYNNTITNTIKYIVALQGFLTLSLTWYNNVLYGVSTNIVAGWGATVTYSIKNSISYNTSSSATLLSNNSGAFSGTYSNNIAYGSYTSIPSGSNNLTSDPLFVDAANGDFRLRPSSPAINTGVAL